ncbi:MAG: T9SS type A sorting domain-containing protein [Saprospiraceae bacterium]
MTQKIQQLFGVFFILILVQEVKSQEILYYCSNSSGTFQVHKKDLGTGIIDTITSDLTYNYWWVEPSPDNTKLLMMRSPVGTGIDNQFDYDTCQMVKSDINGENSTVIVDYNQNGWTAFGNPHWHPSGNRILMLAQPTNEFYIFTIDANGNNQQQLTSQYSLDPNWSSSGDKIVFIGLNNTPTPPASIDDFEVFISNYNYITNTISNKRQLTNDTFRDHDPCFSPNDSLIAFSSAETINLSDANLTIIDPLGNNRVDIVSDNTTNGGPVNWGSNNKIYYHNVNFNVPPYTPFTVKEYDFGLNINIDIFPSITEGYISPYYVNDNSLGIEDLRTMSRLIIYPNPATTTLTLQTPKNLINKSVQIYNTFGQLVKSAKLSQLNTLNIESFPSGTYFLKLNNQAQHYATFIKE